MPQHSPRLDVKKIREEARTVCASGVKKGCVMYLVGSLHRSWLVRRASVLSGALRSSLGLRHRGWRVERFYRVARL